MNKKERKALDLQMSIFDGTAIDLMTAWQKMDYRKCLEIAGTINVMLTRLDKVIKEEVKN